MNWLHAVILGIVEGVTEFLPVSSTGHLNIVEKLLGYDIDSVGMTAFTAVIQVGAILAAVVYFWGDIVRIARAWLGGLASARRRADPDYRLGWGIILGSVPVAVVGLALKDFIEVTSRSLWVIAGALIAWSAVMWLADRHSAGTSAGQVGSGADAVARQGGSGRGGAGSAGAGSAALGRRAALAQGERPVKGMGQVRVLDALIIGCFQALAPVLPGISRSGATISAGLFLRFDRVTATRLSFYMGIPALLAAGALEAVTAADDIAATVGWGATGVATVVSGLVAYATIAWLLRFVSSNKFTSFLVYRVLLGALIIALVAGGVVAA